MPQPVSESLAAFVRSRLPSMDQIEIVLLLRRESGRAWSSPEVSDRLGTPPESTAMRLFLLASNGVLNFEGGGGVPRYRYVGEGEVESLVAQLAQEHESNRPALFEVVGETGRDQIRSFADAFKLKK